jgi:hypothetical protein
VAFVRSILKVVSIAGRPEGDRAIIVIAIIIPDQIVVYPAVPAADHFLCKLLNFF